MRRSWNVDVGSPCVDVCQSHWRTFLLLFLVWLCECGKPICLYRSNSVSCTVCNGNRRLHIDAFYLNSLSGAFCGTLYRLRALDWLRSVSIPRSAAAPALCSVNCDCAWEEKGQTLSFDPRWNRHFLTDRQKFVTGNCVGNPYTCAKFGANPSTWASVQMGET